MLAQFFTIVQRNTSVLDPGVRFKPAVLLAPADAQLGSNSLAAQQAPENDGLPETVGTAQAMAFRCLNHARSYTRPLERILTRII